MTPKTLAAIPAALEAAGDTSFLDVSIADYVGARWSSRTVTSAITTVANILRITTVRGLCTSEAEGLLSNRYPFGTARQVREDLWNWLFARVGKGGASVMGGGKPVSDVLNDLIADAADVGPENEDDDEDEEEFEDGLDDDDDLGELFAFIRRETGPGVQVAKPYSVPALPLPVTFPAIDPLPKTGEALDRWAERYGVTDRLADQLDIEHLRYSYYGIMIANLPTVVREAALVTEQQIKAPRKVQASLAYQLMSLAKSHLLRAALVVAITNRRQSERTARARPLEDPFLLRFESLIREQSALLSDDSPARPQGTFLPGRIQVNAEALALTYREWDMAEVQTPKIAGETVFLVHLSGWESGHLRLECKRCRGTQPCPHRLTMLNECLAALHDPAEPLAAALLPLLRVPGWSRMLDHLDKGLQKIEPTDDPNQRLVWEIASKYGSLAVQPVLQKIGKRGGWGRGQRLQVDELSRKAWLLREAADREAFEGLMYSRDPAGYYYGPREQTPRQLWRALAALTGSTRVFADQSRAVPVSVRKVRPMLRVERGEQGFHLRVMLGPADIEPAVLLAAAPDGRHAVVLQADHGRCLLALLEPETIALLKAMANFPVALPAEGLAELVARLPRLQKSLDLHLPESVRGERVEPPVTTVCRIEPLPDSGLRLDMVVRPIDNGPTFAPGEGTPEVLYLRDGFNLHAMRDLGAERERAVHLAKVLGLDDATANGDWRWDISDDGVALDMLNKLRGLPDLAVVEWPEGEVRVDHAVRGALKVQVKRRRDWFGLEGGIEIDGAQVSLSDLLAAARAGKRYVKLSAHRFATIEDEMRERLVALDDVVFDNKGAIEIGLLAAPVLADLVEDPRQLDMVPAFRSVLGQIETARSENAPLPEGLQATLRHYQDDGFKWLARLASWGLGACLADDMGLGKTVQALALLLRRASLGPALVIAPTSVVANWAAECAKFAPGLAPRIYRGPGRAALLEGVGPGTLLVTSYAIAVRDAETLGAISFSTLIIDEAQSVKNALTQRFRAIRDLQADFRLALTGTPIENHLGELWAIFRLVTPGLLGSWDQFRERFAVPIERHHDRKRQTGLARVVRPFLLRRTKAEVAPELPARTEMNQTIELGPVERRLYEAARVEALESLAKSAASATGTGGGDDAKQRIKILAALTRLRLLCCHPRLVVKDSQAGSAKLAALVELLTELRDEGHRALVFSQFTSFLDLARPMLANAGLRTLTLDGSTPAAEREERVRAFQAGTADAFLLSLRAGGTGLNLTAATYVIHLDPWWNPAVEDQATDRAHRIGQERPVTVIRMVARATIEEAVLSLHEEKRKLAASILDGADVAARLDGEDLLDLIRGAGVTAEDDEAQGDEGELEGEETPTV